ncbi:hypothetical protein GIB67_041983 [Kingdonia uniflora]|uniref:Uncharacterized protein n=1 Tax=Kingdonia uniflora TaxID=39325 RepID=A0A7J7NZZ9_9MAGN|nr:hypothetical protein GIB67_041983 [Kingdonia uniflora]
MESQFSSIEANQTPIPLKIQAPLEPTKPVDLGPITPISNRESLQVSPLTCVSSNQESSSPRTPKEDIFDPFAPGPDAMMLAPRVKKVNEEARVNVSRRLNFGECCSDEDDKLLECVYESLLDAIVSNQVEAVVAQTPLTSDGDGDGDVHGFETPTKLPLLTGVADTCPGAPKKPRQDSRDIDRSMCKRLDFGGM